MADHAPIVAVNTAYDPTARIFTLFHEVGHLVTRTDSACLRFVFPDEQPIGGVERWCERFAAGLLLPGDALRAAARREGVTPATGVRDVWTVRRIAKRFKVSTRAAALRFQELDLAPSTLYDQVDRELSQFDWNRRSGGGGGQPAPEKRLSQLGSRVPRLLIESAHARRITRADLSGYLRLTIGQVEDLRALVSGGV